MEGNIKIELFDAKTNTKEKELKDHNFIANGLKFLIRESPFDYILRGKIDFFNDSFTPSRQVLDNLYLTNTATPEDPEKDFYVAGHVVGESSLTISGSVSGTTGGVLNTSESFFKNDKLRFVVDFPTDKANGTFNNIFTGHKKGLLESSGFANHDISFFNSIKYENLYFTLENDQQTICKRDSELKILESRVMPTKVGIYTVVNNNLYMRNTGGWSYQKVLKIDLNHFLTGNVIEYSKPANAGAFFNKNEELHFVDVAGNSYYKATETDGVLVTEKIADINGESYSNTISYDNGALIFDRTILNLETNEKYDYCYRFSGHYGKNYVFVNSSRSSKLFILPKSMIGSRSLLSEPVTKTNTQTMKITYEFTLPSLYD
ncbi:hypothetical protein SporoP37_01875 [Sporosarcina sp. P37]|uniref:hypothetical protein n=1 Tax=unclassified Sporosarcina TaxID=2647733 RepID=UPI000A17C3BB|nr:MULTISPECIES: hypothetical protein [unclassified Sporosarcina]ARK23563.1 hypothetical protein SporoP37_01875 [Sporosarcina sp. P37]PID18814.1 hypothetical protein CSV62_06875 [Sporosarcina sp. P35]